MLVIFGCGIIIFLIANIFSSKSIFTSSKKNPKLQVGNMTINQLIQMDSDWDGVLDWEESLWGTDPKKENTFGVSDATYIADKRKEIESDPSQENKTLTETDKFAREFFAAFAAMKNSGQIDNQTIENFSSSLGENLVDATLINKYSENDIVLAKEDETKDWKEYYLAAGTLFEGYKEKGIGYELELTGGIASIGKAEGIQEYNDELLKIAKAYQDFSKELLLVPVPESLKDYHIKILNNSNNTGIAVVNMSKIVTDPIVGISGLSQYEKYSADLVSSVKDLESLLEKNGIITAE